MYKRQPWPGLTPDLLSVLLVVATQAKGSVLIHQKMFESRLFCVDKLIDMGAQIIDVYKRQDGDTAEACQVIDELSRHHQRLFVGKGYRLTGSDGIHGGLQPCI